MFVLIQRHEQRHSKSATSSWPDKGNMPWDRKRLLGHVETMQLILGVTDKTFYRGMFWLSNKKEMSFRTRSQAPRLYNFFHAQLNWAWYFNCS